MTGYTISYDIPYEGLQEVQVCTLDEAKTWLRDNRSSYDFSLDNVRVRPNVPEIDVYELMAGRD